MTCLNDVEITTPINMAISGIQILILIVQAYKFVG